MPETPSSPDSQEKRHDATLAKVMGREQEIDKKMAGKKALGVFLEHLRLLLQLVGDYFKGNYREVPYWAMGAFALAVVYVVSPIDAIPDLVPGLGFLDDAAVLAFCLKLVQTELDKYREWRKTREVTVAKV